MVIAIRLRGQRMAANGDIGAPRGAMEGLNGRRQASSIGQLFKRDLTRVSA